MHFKTRSQRIVQDFDHKLIFARKTRGQIRETLPDSTSGTASSTGRCTRLVTFNEELSIAPHLYFKLSSTSGVQTLDTLIMRDQSCLANGRRDQREF